MSAVRFNLNPCDQLVQQQALAATAVGSQVNALSPLVSEAMQLLERAVHPLYSPMVGMHDTSLGLRTNSRDLEWRIEFVRRLDGSGFDGAMALSAMPDWTPAQAEAFFLAQDIAKAVEQRDEGSVFEQERRRGELESMIAAFIGNDDPAAIAAVLAGLLEGDDLITSIQTAGVRMEQAAHRELVREIASDRDITFAEAELVWAQMQSTMLQLVEQGFSPQDAVLAMQIAHERGLHIDHISELAAYEGIGLVDAISLQLTAQSRGMTVNEHHAYEGLKENFTIFDNATGGERDGLVSLQDLQYVVNNPGRFDAAVVASAAALLANRNVLTRLDSALDNGDVLNNGDAFGDDSFDDYKISQADIENFDWKQAVNSLVGIHYDEVDVAALGGATDGHLSKADFESFLAEHRDSLTEQEVIAFETVIDGELYDKGWLERNKKSLSIIAAVGVGALIVGLTGGLGAGFSGALITMAVTGGAGAAAAGATTLTINAFSDESDWDDDLAANAANGFLGGMAGGGLGALGHAVPATTSVMGRTAIGLGAVSDVTAVAGMGGFDFAIDAALDIEPGDLDGFHDGANTISFATGIYGLGAMGLDGTIAWYRAGMADGLANSLPPNVVAKSETFVPNGVSREAALEFLDTADGQRMFDLASDFAPGTPQDILEQRVLTQVMSGKEVPTIIETNQSLVKVVPSGESVSGHSPFWMTLDSYNDLRASGRDVFDALGLPYSSYAPTYDAVAIAARPDGAVVFASEIAPTTELQGFVRNSGGVEQVLVPNRNMFSEPTLLEWSIERVPQATPPVREAVNIPLSGLTASTLDDLVDDVHGASNGPS